MTTEGFDHFVEKIAENDHELILADDVRIWSEDEDEDC